MTHDEMIAVIQAHKDGKAIQVRVGNGLGAKWEPSTAPAWNFVAFDYRVKPEPREWWVNVWSDGECFRYPSRAEADAVSSGSRRLECVHVREVLE